VVPSHSSKKVGMHERMLLEIMTSTDSSKPESGEDKGTVRALQLQLQFYHSTVLLDPFQANALLLF